ncbi:beta strand repeat-containing protein [Mesorhizobium comanense]|uniref:beta strand repeat-containing protein n=1 Tax=Mesorhizobium comanense TaxID=2502215 RepID=UPI0010F79E00|nr:adhesin [Mesorhizobium comanense]
MRIYDVVEYTPDPNADPDETSHTYREPAPIGPDDPLYGTNFQNPTYPGMPDYQNPYSPGFDPHLDQKEPDPLGAANNAPTGPDAGQDHGVGWQSYSPGSPDNNAATGENGGYGSSYGFGGNTGPSPDDNSNGSGEENGGGSSTGSTQNTEATGENGGYGSSYGFGGSTNPAPGDNNGVTGAPENSGETQDGETTGNDTGDTNDGAGSDDGGEADAPILLDLSGKGLSVNSLSSSSQFLDLKGDGYQHRTAWAGAGNGVLVLDLYGDGQIHQQNQFAFTAWDPSANGDLQALKDVFDTNHDGKLDAGDADWSEFKVEVNGQMVSLASLGITSIDLTPTGSGQTFNDGSAISGTTTYTKSDGTTGQVGDAVLASDSNGYLIHQTQTTNADSSVTTDILGYNADGSEAFENVVTVSANGLGKTTKYDDDGNGVFDRTQTDNTVTNADGSSTETITDFNADGSKRDATAVTTSADTKTVTTLVDQNGDGTWDQSEIFITNADGSTSTTTKNLATNGSTINQIAVATSTDGLTKTTSTDHVGGGTFDHITTAATVVNTDGSRVETVTDTGKNGTLLDKTITTTSADARSKTVQIDHAGAGTFDEVRSSSIVINADNSVTTTVQDKNADGSTRDSTVTTISADGLRKSVSHYLDGSGTALDVSSDGIVVGADGSRTETVTDTSGNGTLLSKSVTVTSGDKKTITVTIDANGDGAADQSKTILVNADGSTTTTLSNFSSNGTLISRTLATAAANGLSMTTETDLNGDGTYDLTEADVITGNADGSKTETVTDTSANGALIGKSITNTTANGLTQTRQQDLNGDGTIDRTVTDAIVLNADGSRTETLSTTSNTGALLSRTVTTDSADRKTTTVTIDSDGDGHVDQTNASVLNADGSTTQTVTDTSASGAQIDQTVTTTSANGLSISVTHNIDGAIDDTLSDVTVLNTDGSKTETIADTSRNGILLDKRIVTTSGNGLSVTTQNDANGDGVLDSEITDVTVLNADGSKTDTVSTYNGAGTTLIGKTVITTSGDGLTQSASHYRDGSGTVSDIVRDVAAIATDGSRAETVTDNSSNGTLISKTVTTTSADRKTVTVNTDLDGNGVNDISITATTNADGSATSVTSTYSATGGLISKSTRTVSANGLSTTIATDLNGDGAVDQSKTDVTVLNADGSRTETISDLNASGGLKDKIVVTTSANGLSVTRQMDGTGAGTFSRTSTDIKTLNADGSTTEVVSDLNANGTLHDKTTTTTSANQMTVTTTRDINGDGTTDQTVIRQVNADGSMTTSSMDGAVQSASGRSYGATNGRYETDSANGLSKAVQYDANGNGLAESQTTDVTVLNAVGSNVETIMDSTLTGGVASSAAPVYTVTTKDKEVITTSTDGLTVTEQFDLTGAGTFGETKVDQRVLNADGSTTETITETKAGVQTDRYLSSTSGNGLSTTRQWFFGTATTASETETDMRVVNVDGSSTQTLTNKNSDGSLLSKTVRTTSANGITVSIQQDTTGSGSFNQGQTDSTAALADGSVVRTVSDFNIDGSLRDSIRTQTTADQRVVTISRDADGDGIVDQTEVRTKAIDGGVTDVTTAVTSTGAKVDQAISIISFDGLTTNTSWDFNADGIIDHTRTDTKTFNADGSYAETWKDYQTSTKTATGWGAAITPVLLKTTTGTVSADGRTRTTTVKLNNDTSADETSTTITAIDGSMVTTTTNDAAAKGVVPLPGEVLWNSSIATSNRTVASKVITTVSADGLSKTVQADYDGNGTYEHTETWQTQIDGSQLGTIQDVNASGAVGAKATATISADGLTTTLSEITRPVLLFPDHVDTATTHADGSITETVTDYDIDHNPTQIIVTNVTPDGQSVSVVTKTATASTTLVTGNGTKTIEPGTVDTATITGSYNMLTVTSGQETATVSGTGNTINVNGNASASVTGGTGTVVNFNSLGNAMSATSSTINLRHDSNVTIAGSGNTIDMGANDNVALVANANKTGHSDTFVFQPGFGNSIVSNFYSNTTPDQIDISHAVFADWAHLLAASSQSGSDVIITHGFDSITLKNMTVANLQGDQSQFHFT